MGAGEDAGGEAQLTRRQGVLHVDGADELVLRRGYGELDYREPLEELAEGAHDGGLGRALLPEDEDAAEAGVYEVEQQGTLHLLLAYDGAEGEVSRLRAGA